MLNRKIAPSIHTIQNLHLPRPQVHHLSNGIPVYEVHLGTQDVVKVEVIFKAGRPQEKQQLVGRTTARMLREGTTSRSSAAIAELVDFYGGTLSFPVNFDTANIVLYSLNKHFEKLLPVLRDVITAPTFPEKELKSYSANSIQQIKVNNQKADIIAYREITARIFGDKHPYGYNSTEEGYRALNREHILQHYKAHYHSDNCVIIISGKTSEQMIHRLEMHLGKSIPTGTTSDVIIPEITPSVNHIHIPLKNTVQSAVRIGCRLFNRHHSDSQGIAILNTLLGGYFGSRLMANIREDKGYTYNIYSTLDSMVYDGCFYIGTEVGNEYLEDTLKEIYKEFERLQNELVSDSEMLMVRNYMLGVLLNMLDGPFNVAEVVRTMVVENLSFERFHEFEQYIQAIKAEDIRTLAQKYLQKEKMWQVVVGA